MKEKLRKIYTKFLDSLELDDPTDYKMFKLATEIDGKMANKIKILFLLSLFCNVFHHIYGKKSGQLATSLNFTPKIRCNNYTIFTYNNDKTDKLLQNLVTFFNTDATNLLPITSLILQDLNEMNIYMKL